MRWKAIRPVRRDEGTDFEHDLVAVAQDERAHVTSPAHPVAVGAHSAPEAEQPRRREARAPHAKEITERRATGEVHDTGRIERPRARTAACRSDAAEREPRIAESDGSGHDDHASLGKELHVHASTSAERRRHAPRVNGRAGVVGGPNADRSRLNGKHALHAIALFAVAGLAGCGGGSSGTPTISIQPAQQFRLTTHIAGSPATRTPIKITYSIQQPNGSNLTQFKRGAGPHTGVHVIYVRDDLGAIVHHHPHIAANGTFTDTVDFPLSGPYRVVIDVYPQQSTPQPNFQLFTRVRVRGAYTPEPLPPPKASETVNGYTFVLHGAPHLRAIQAAFLSFTVTGRNGAPAQFTPWFGALAHAIFFRKGSLDYFHTHVCAPGAPNCTSLLGGAKVTGTSTTPGKLTVGVLVPVAGTWRLFLQCLVGGHVLTAPFTLQVR
jgi:hypothetical protein